MAIEKSVPKRSTNGKMNAAIEMFKLLIRLW